MKSLIILSALIMGENTEPPKKPNCLQCHEKHEDNKKEHKKPNFITIDDLLE